MVSSMASPGPSFETPHNAVHNDAGCSDSTIATITWSAFDPLFMLHHANVDRLFAMWQAIYYNDSLYALSGTSTGQFGTVAGTPISIDTPLKPFHDQNTTLHTSRSVRNISGLGYTYPEIDWSVPAEQLAKRVRYAVNSRYDQNGSTASKRKPQRRHYRPAMFKYYTAEIQLDRSEVQLPCSLVLLVQGRVVGRMTLLDMPTVGIAHASLSIRAGLEEFNVGDMPGDAVIPFLQQHVVVEIRKNDGTKIRLDSIPSLKIQIQGIDYAPRASDNDFPIFGRATKWAITGSRE